MLNLPQKILDINKKNSDDETPLHIAINNSYIDIIFKLLEKNADIEIDETYSLLIIYFGDNQKLMNILNLLPF